MSRWPIITGGRADRFEARAIVPPCRYTLATNVCGQTYVLFGWSPSDNVLDCVMVLAEAVGRGLVAMPRPVTLRLAVAVSQ